MMKWMKTVLCEKEFPRGTFCCLGSIDALELALDAGFDFVLVDAQHGGFAARDLREAVRAADAAGGVAIARIPAHGLATVEGLLDAGYTALLAPMVNTPEAASELVEAVYYAPHGTRSISGCRASLRGGETYPETFNRDFLLMVMIEHITAVEHAEAILSVDGVGAGFVGTSDLARSLGPDSSAELKEAVAAALAAGRADGKPMGISARSMEAARAYREQGFDFVILSTDRRQLQSAYSNLLNS